MATLCAGHYSSSQLLTYIAGFNLGLQVIKFQPLVTNVCTYIKQTLDKRWFSLTTNTRLWSTNISTHQGHYVNGAQQRLGVAHCPIRCPDKRYQSLVSILHHQGYQSWVNHKHPASERNQKKKTSFYWTITDILPLNSYFGD